MNAPKTHPAYGHISINRQHANRESLFGTSVAGYNCVSLCISTATYDPDAVNRGCAYTVDKRLIEVVMSPYQFAEMVACMNQHEGSPCTINWLDGKFIKMPEAETSFGGNVVEQFQLSMTALTAECEELVGKARALQEKPSISKADRAEFTALAEGIVGHVKIHIPHLAEQFAEVVERMKAEVHADQAADTGAQPL
jgi:hypothetical protein